MTHFQKPSSVDLQLYLERSTDRSCHLIMAEELKRNKDFQNQYINFYFVFSTFMAVINSRLHFLIKGGQVQKKLSYPAHVLKASVMNPCKGNSCKNGYMQAKANFKKFKIFQSWHFLVSLHDV